MKTTSPLFRLAFLASLLIGLHPALAADTASLTKKAEEKNALPYHITRNDVLSVVVIGEPDLTGGNKKVLAAGTINLGLIDEIRVVGLTIPEAQVTIEKAYQDGRFLRNPKVTVTIEQYAQRTIVVQGLVNNPGRIEIPPDEIFTLKDAILKANGFRDTAKGTAVKVTRTLPDGTLKVFDNLDVDSVFRGKSKARAEDANFPLEPDDIVYVPEKMI
jgi:polysaccharide export outer membrane protein